MQKRFYNREAIGAIGISKLAEIFPLSHDWPTLFFKLHRREEGYEGYLLNCKMLRGICFSSIKSLLNMQCESEGDW